MHLAQLGRCELGAMTEQTVHRAGCLVPGLKGTVACTGIASRHREHQAAFEVVLGPVGIVPPEAGR